MIVNTSRTSLKRGPVTVNEKIASALAGPLTDSGRVFITRLSELRAKSLGLWNQELEFLDHLHTLQQTPERLYNYKEPHAK